MNAKLIAAALLLVGATAFFMAIQPRGLSQFGPADAVSTAIGDATGFLVAHYGQSQRDIEIISTSYDNGKWRVIFDVTVLPHSYCPEVQRLTYEMFPIVFRNETLVDSSDCRARPITRKPEAIINSYALSPKVRSLASDGYMACAFSYPVADLQAAEGYCYFLDIRALNSFATTRAVPLGSWIVQWSVPGKTAYFVALDDSGRIIAQG